jgi:hypothetical protein
MLPAAIWNGEAAAGDDEAHWRGDPSGPFRPSSICAVTTVLSGWIGSMCQCPLNAHGEQR